MQFAGLNVFLCSIARIPFKDFNKVLNFAKLFSFHPANRTLSVFIENICLQDFILPNLKFGEKLSIK